METISVRKRRGYFLIGGAGVFLSLAYLGLSLKLPFGQLDQPGAAIFPIIVGAILLMSSVAAMLEGFKTGQAEMVAFPGGANLKRLLTFVGLLLGYFLILPWLGHIIASTLFCVLLMRILCTLSWVRIVIYSAIISVTLYAFFVVLLKLPLPRGVLLF